MSIATVLSSINTINSNLAQQRKKLYESQKKKASKSAEMVRVNNSINKNTPQSTLQSKKSQINRCQQEILKCEVSEAAIMKKIADEEIKLARKHVELGKARTLEQKKIEENYSQAIALQQQKQNELLNELISSKSVANQDQTEDVSQNKKYDFFISHASEDKNEIARPLFSKLVELGAEVWFDEFTMTIGDNLRRSIEKGLVNSRFGVVILSESFFEKAWTNFEMDGLVQRQMVEEKVILPVWHNVSKDKVMSYSPTLANLIAFKTSDYSVDEIAGKLIELIK